MAQLIPYVKVVVWTKGHDPLDSAIKFFSHGTGTHAAFLWNGLIVENFYPSVRVRNWLPGEKDKVEVFEIEGLDWKDYQRLHDYFDLALKDQTKYSILDLFRYLFNLPPLRGNRCFCSMFVLKALRLCTDKKKQIITRLDYQDYASPRDIRLSPRLHRVEIF